MITSYLYRIHVLAWQVVHAKDNLAMFRKRDSVIYNLQVNDRLEKNVNALEQAKQLL